MLRGDEPNATDPLRRTAVAGSAGLAAVPARQADRLQRGLAAGPRHGGRRRECAARPGQVGGLVRAGRGHAREVIDYGFHSMIIVPLRARGVVLGVAGFLRAETAEPFEDEDLALAEELVTRAAVSIDNARRYTREHTMAVTLQRSLLPRNLPEQNALDVAYRYLPAESGVGGDWFDVIPLPGARVALVVGDVVGHGLHAAATMGRLRTAVHNFSTLDLPPDELLGHLDELIARIDEDDEGGGAGDEDGPGAGCRAAAR
ncbi:SpoIIE family protein phosphatase [Streptomyces sp. M19]